MEDIVFIGDWIKDRELGSGSFGTVVLWRHKKTDEKLAIKTCKWGDELTDKHKERWTKEVEMLQNCTNPNIVRIKELPTEFVKGLQRANPSGLPIMCMEFCSGGDLRQLLNKPESCSGLKEIQVRQILSDIGNAVQFLHENKITHRDLKPENVVMHIIDNTTLSENNPTQRKVLYKLIDLGYAKEIDSQSISASFVGTLQYLAPEFFYSKTYSNSVDFWSFGLLVFEIICGKRPFLQFMAPVQWMTYVKKKLHEHICVYETFHGDIEYSDEIFPENHISKPFKMLIEEWLRIALEWDPKLRGRNSSSRVTFNIPTEKKETMSSQPVIFNILESILSKKVIKIFSVATLSSIAYEINETTTVLFLKQWLEKDTKIPRSEQVLISQNNFTTLENDDLVVNYWNEFCTNMLYLYSKSFVLQGNIGPIVPKAIQRSLEHPKALYNFKNSKNLYQNGLYFVMSQMEIYESLVSGLFVRAESLKLEGNKLLLKHNEVDKAIGNLLTKQISVKQISETGKIHIKSLRNSGTGTNLLGGFDKNFKDIDDINEKIMKLQAAWPVVTVRLQSATRRCNEVISTDLNNFVGKYNYQGVYTNALKAYITYKKNESSGEYKGKERQCHDIMKACYDCLKLRSKILLEIQNQPFILKLMDLSVEFAKIADIVSNASENTAKLLSDLTNALDELTNCVWSTISLLIKDTGDLVDLPYSVVNLQKQDFKIGQPVSNHRIKMVSKIEEEEQLNLLIKESLKIRLTHKNLSQRLNSQKEILKKSVIDFSFLNEE